MDPWRNHTSPDHIDEQNTNYFNLGLGGKKVYWVSLASKVFLSGSAAFLTQLQVKHILPIEDIGASVGTAWFHCRRRKYRKKAVFVFFKFTRLPRTCICKASRETVHSPRIPTYSNTRVFASAAEKNPHRAAPKFIPKRKRTSSRTRMFMKNDPEVTHNNSHVGPSVQNKATGQQTLVLYQTPAQQIFQRGIAKILNKKESCIENDVKTRCLQLRIWRSWHDTIHMPHSNLNSFNFIRL